MPMQPTSAGKQHGIAQLVRLNFIRMIFKVESEILEGYDARVDRLNLFISVYEQPRPCHARQHGG